jgi:CRP-like cAMP-binding protein
MTCLKPVFRQYDRESVILNAGEHTDKIGMVVSGKIQIVKEDFFGNRSILTEIEEKGLFAESFPFVRIKKLPVTVISVTESEVMFIDHKAIITGCKTACGFHSKLIENMLYIVTRKNLILNRKIEHISERTTREKLLSYLSSQAQEEGSCEFYIPFDRQQLADYLCVERSAMSAELSKLRKEGVLDYKKNRFKILAVTDKYQ